MAAGDHAALIEACVRLGDAARGGDAHLWTEVLEYLGSQDQDCSAQARPHLACVGRPCPVMHAREEAVGAHQFYRSLLYSPAIRRCHPLQM